MSTKLPPKQTTRIFESSPTLKTEANFRNFVDIFSNVGFRFDPVRTHPIGSERFDYVVSHTKTHIGLLTRIVISAGSLSGFFPRIEGDNQLVALICVLKGPLTITQRSETRQFKRDDFIIADPHLAMTIFAKKPASFFCILVSENYFYTHAGFRTASFYGRSFHSESKVQVMFANVLSVVSEQITEVDARDVGDMCDGLFRFLRPVLAEFSRVQHAGLQRHEDFIRACAVDVMHHYFNQPQLTRERIAEKVGVSSRYLARLFVQTGTTVMERLKEIRLTRASVQLVEEHMAHASIAEIAATNGFSSAAHFCRVFKKRFAMTPMQWRQTRRSLL